VVYLLSWCLIVNTTVMAAPSGGVFTVGTGTIVEGANTAVTVNQAQSIVQWGAPGSPGSGGIDTSTTESLTFLQAGGLSNSAVLNRIMSGNPTQFNGTLNGLDMRIFIVNPAGVIFGNGSMINVSQLVASGLNMSNEDFLNATDGSPTDFRFEGGNGVVENWGLIQANSVYLVGKQVTNKGADIAAPNGLVVLAAGDNVYLAQDGSNVLVEVAGPSEYLYDVDNRSGIHARNGTIILAAGDTFSRAINNSSWLVAQGGSIELQAARIENTGVITTSTDDGDGGDIKLTGIDEVIIATDAHPRQEITADGGANGGTITIESAGTVTIGAGTLVSARGGNVSGDGGSVKITAEHFVIAGQIDASPGNTDYEPGTLEIDPAIVTIATGANAGATDTLYENDIETWGTKGTSLVVKADSGITVQNITDGEIKGRYGNIELYATGAESLVSFEDTTDTISTTLGDIRMTAGAGGLNIGNLQTGGENLEATPGEIHLSTHDGGDITAENLSIHGGQGHAEINVDAADDLTINGDVSVGRDLPGSDSPIYNVPNGQDAEAMIYLKAGDNVVLNGDVRADSHGLNEDIEGSVTKSYIGIFSGTGVPVFGSTTVNGDLVSTAKASSNGTSNATIEINAWGTITWGPEAAAPLADGDAGQVHVQSKTSAEDTDPDGDIARIIISSAPGHVPQVVATPDVAQTHMGALVQGNVLTNDVDPDPQGNAMTATLVQGPTHATNFVLNANGSYSYTPQAGYVGTDTFTYTAGKGGVSSAPVSVTITMTNALPVAGNDTAATTQNVAVIINVMANDSDADSDPLTAALVNGPANGTLTQNADKTFTYTPAKSFSGQDTFTYSITDGQTGAVPAQATVTITVNPMAPPSSSPAAPGLERVDFELSGCPALVKWAATELGVGARAVEVRIANALALTRDIQPCSSCADLKDAAMILKDADGTHVAALTQIVNEFAAAGAPPTEEQMATIADTIAKNAKGNNRYAVAGEYLDAVAQYVGVLVGKLGFSTEESVLLVTDKYINRLAQTGNANVAAMVAKLAVLAAK
jgi:filamentous hemagglutinin family protein